MHILHKILCLLLDLSSGLEGGLGDMPIEVLHIILSHLLQSSEDEVGVSRESTETFVEILRRGTAESLSQETVCSPECSQYIFMPELLWS